MDLKLSEENNGTLEKVFFCKKVFENAGQLELKWYTIINSSFHSNKRKMSMWQQTSFSFVYWTVYIIHLSMKKIKDSIILISMVKIGICTIKMQITSYLENLRQSCLNKWCTLCEIILKLQCVSFISYIFSQKSLGEHVELWCIFYLTLWPRHSWT